MTLIAFDLDGTLEDSRDDMVAAVQRVRASLGLVLRPDGDFRPHVNRGMGHLYEVCFDEYLAQSGDPAGLETVRSKYVDDYGRHIASSTQLYTGMAAALEACSNLGSMAVVTNKPESLSDRLLHALGIRHYFASVIGGDTCALPKPNPDPLLEAAKRSNSSDSTIMIGDSAGDIRCARACGYPVVWCAWGYAASYGPVKPDFVAHEPKELHDIIALNMA